MNITHTLNSRVLLSVSPRLAVVFLAVSALALKIYCAATTFGTDDVVLHFCYGRYIDANGLIAIYQNYDFFNHTPITAGFFRFIYGHSGPDHGLFPFYLRLAGIIADFLVVLALVRLRDRTGKPPWWVLALFAASPVSFMISGYHGNVDPVLVLFLVLGACACVESRPLLCGIFFGLACNVKIVALLLSPVFFFFWLHRAKSLRFAIPAVLLALAGWLPALLKVPGLFVKNVLCYNSTWGQWGVTYWLAKIHVGEGQMAILAEGPYARGIINLFKLVIIVSAFWIAWRRRALEGSQVFVSVACVWNVFFVLTPGFGPQYMVWPAPFFLVFSAGWYLALTAASSWFLFMFYNVISHGMPWDRGICESQLTSLWISWNTLPWGVLVACLFVAWRKDNATA